VFEEKPDFQQWAAPLFTPAPRTLLGSEVQGRRVQGGVLDLAVFLMI